MTVCSHSSADGRDADQRRAASQREELSVEFDPEVAELLLVGMVVTGTYNLLSDGTWCFTQVRRDTLASQCKTLL